jgi:hypothetical protein
LKALLATFFCIVTAGCANGWPATHHPQPKSTQAASGCKTSGSRILHSDCSTITPASQTSGDDFDQERTMHPAVGGITTPN